MSAAKVKDTDTDFVNLMDVFVWKLIEEEKTSGHQMFNIMTRDYHTEFNCQKILTCLRSKPNPNPELEPNPDDPIFVVKVVS